MTKIAIEAAIAAITWLEPWAPVGSRGTTLEQALQRELVSGHVLFGREARAIACRRDRDDVLFLIGDPAQFAVVHLTYSKSRSPEWPHTMLFGSLEEFEAGCMRPDHEEHTDLDDE